MRSDVLTLIWSKYRDTRLDISSIRTQQLVDSADSQNEINRNILLSSAMPSLLCHNNSICSRSVLKYNLRIRDFRALQSSALFSPGYFTLSVHVVCTSMCVCVCVCVVHRFQSVRTCSPPKCQIIHEHGDRGGARDARKINSSRDQHGQIKRSEFFR